MTDNILVPVPVAQSLMDYLKKRPYEEVAPLIAQLFRCPKEPKPEPAPAPEVKTQ